LRWDSLGEFLALAVSLEHLGNTFNNERAKVLGDTLDQATASFLENGKSPSRKVLELDNRGSHFYLTMYWAQALASQDKDPALKEIFGKVAKALVDSEAKIIEELKNAQGQPVDIGGYFKPDPDKTTQAMRPSKIFNEILSLATANG